MHDNFGNVKNYYIVVFSSYYLRVRIKLILLELLSSYGDTWTTLGKPISTVECCYYIYPLGPATYRPVYELSQNKSAVGRQWWTGGGLNTASPHTLTIQTLRPSILPSLRHAFLTDTTVTDTWLKMTSGNKVKPMLWKYNYFQVTLQKNIPSFSFFFSAEWLRRHSTSVRGFFFLFT